MPIQSGVIFISSKKQSENHKSLRFLERFVSDSSCMMLTPIPIRYSRSEGYLVYCKHGLIFEISALSVQVVPVKRFLMRLNLCFSLRRKSRWNDWNFHKSWLSIGLSKISNVSVGHYRSFLTFSSTEADTYGHSELNFVQQGR